MDLEANLLERLRRVRLMAFDVDGVLTDGGLYIGRADEWKRFNTQDGAGLAICRRLGIPIAFISGRESESVRRRAEEQRVTEVHLQVTNKVKMLEGFLERNGGAGPESLMYMGDDLMDIPALNFAGLAIGPANAVTDVRSICHYITLSRGGYGAVREAIELVLRNQDRWETAVEELLTETGRLSQ